MRRFSSLSLILLPLVLGGCGTLASGQSQTVTLQTPGAVESECILDNGVRHKVRNGESVNVMRTGNDLMVECYASGNRYLKKSFPSSGNPWALGNAVTGIVPGTAYDHLAGGLHRYPETIVMDFTGMPAPGFGLPEYHNVDSPNPYNQPIESYAASEPKMQSDSKTLKRGLEKRERIHGNPFEGLMGDTPAVIVDPEGSDAGSAVVTPAKPSPSKTAPATPKGQTAEELTREMNPTVFEK